MKPEKILISACLLGEAVRYNGQPLPSDQLPDQEIIRQWADEECLVPVCPEVESNLPVPRPPAEIQGQGGGSGVLNGQARVMDCEGADVTLNFMTGARIALHLAQEHNIKIAILNQRSPSCGSSHIYDGSFSSRKIPGQGVTTALLRANGLKIFDQTELNQAVLFITELKKMTTSQTD